jgi:dynein heavy chain 1
MTKKKFAELELSLLHLQQNVEIPETHLIIHPTIQRAVEQVFNTPLLETVPSSRFIGKCVWRSAEYFTHP